MCIQPLLLCILLSGDPFLIKDTGVFYPLGKGAVKIAQNGTLFILDPSEQVVKRFSADGALQGIVGRRGEGPGEYTRPWGLFLQGDHFYIRDRRSRKILVYNLQGEFKHHVAEPHDGYAIARVNNGWAQANWRLGEQDDPVDVFLSNEQLQASKKVLSWDRAGTDILTNIQLSGSGITKLPYNPAKNYATMTASLDYKTLFIYQPAESFRVAVVDVASGKVHYIKRPNLPRIPFNETWGEEELAVQQESYNRRGYADKLRWTPDFPEYFPWVKRLMAGPDQTLVIERWSGTPDQKSYYLVVNHQGEDAKLPYAPKNEARILGLRDGKAYISAFSDDRASVLLVDIADVDKTIAAHPFDYGED